MNPDQERTQLRSQAETIMAEVLAFGVTAADPLNAVQLLIARIDELESRSIRAASAASRGSTEDRLSDAERVAKAFYEEGCRLEVEANPKLLKDDHADERPETWDELDDDDRHFTIQVFINLLATGQITAGLPTTGNTPVYDVTVAPHLIEHDTAPTVAAIVRERDALRLAIRDRNRPLVHRLEELRTATIAAREVAQMVVSAGSDMPTMDAAAGWIIRFDKLADLPMEITVEDDDDPADTPTEGEHWVKESSEPGARETTGSGGPVAHPAGWPMTD